MPHPRRKLSIKPYGLNPKTMERLRSQTHKQTNKPGWKVWKICRPWNEKGHVLESCPLNVNELLNLTAVQLYHLGQKNNCNKDAA